MGLVGFGFSANALAADGTDLRSQRVQDLKSLVLARAEDASRAEQAVKRLRSEVSSLSVEYSTPQLRRVRAKIAKLRDPAAVEPVSGRAVVVTLDDAPSPTTGQAGEDYDPNWFLVHQQDIEAVVNALWLGGAEGITVMGERIAGPSAVRCVGSTVLINGKVFSPPFVIIAVGSQSRLTAALAKDENVQYFVDLATTFGLKYDVRELANASLPGFAGSSSVQYAGPLN